ncbi:hypothetical protein B7486_66270 [cyanobacterium TDX16]|nr:hypothetical protein B7486_66270 [cyanobacterium TDX16]
MSWQHPTIAGKGRSRSAGLRRRGEVDERTPRRPSGRRTTSEEPHVTTEPPGADGAFIALYEREFAIAAHAAYTIVGSTSRAQDLAQDALTAAYARWDHVQQLDRPGAWVRRVAINLAVKDRAKAARQSLGVDEAVAPPVSDVDHDTRAVLADAIRRLPDRQRVAVVLHYFHDLPLVEVAESLGCAESTAKVHLHRARRTLAATVGGALRPS